MSDGGRRTANVRTILASLTISRPFEQRSTIVQFGEASSSLKATTLLAKHGSRGKFIREFTQSPAGPLPPNGQRVVWDLLNIFRFDDQGRLVEEWVRTDYRSFLRQLGAQGK